MSIQLEKVDDDKQDSMNEKINRELNKILGNIKDIYDIIDVINDRLDALENP